MKTTDDFKIRTGGTVILIPTDMIVPNPNQPRRVFNESELNGLALSIKNNGILQPLIVRRTGFEKYELISGERRLRAAKIAGLNSVPCLMMSVTDEQSALYAVIENVQRDDLNFFEEAESIEKLISIYGLSQSEISKKLGRSQSALSNKLRLLSLSSELRKLITDNNLTERHARALLKIKDDVDRLKVLLYIIDRKLNVNETDKYIEKFLNPVHKKNKPKFKKLKDIKIFQNTINHAVDTMRKAGIKAVSTEYETGEYYEYIVRIPKMTSSPVNIADYSGNAV